MNADELIEIIQDGFVISIIYHYDDNFTQFEVYSRQTRDNYTIILRPHDRPLVFEISRIKTPVNAYKPDYENIELAVSPEMCYRIGTELCSAALKFAMNMESDALIEKVFYMSNSFLKYL